MTYHVERVEWLDAVADTGWKATTDRHDAQRCVSIGLVVCETKESITLAGTWGNNNGVLETNARMIVPKAWLLDRKKLQVKV